MVSLFTAKKEKTILLLIVLILVNSMILEYKHMILRTTNESKQTMQEKTNSKIVAEITS